MLVFVSTHVTGKDGDVSTDSCDKQLHTEYVHQKYGLVGGYLTEAGRIGGRLTVDAMESYLQRQEKVSVLLPAFSKKYSAFERDEVPLRR